MIIGKPDDNAVMYSSYKNGNVYVNSSIYFVEVTTSLLFVNDSAIAHNWYAIYTGVHNDHYTHDCHTPKCDHTPNPLWLL